MMVNQTVMWTCENVCVDFFFYTSQNSSWLGPAWQKNNLPALLMRSSQMMEIADNFLSYTELSHMCMCNSKIWLLIQMVKWVRWDELMLRSLLVKMKKDRSHCFIQKEDTNEEKTKQAMKTNPKKHLKTYTWKWTCEGRGGKQINLTRKGDRENCKYTHMLMRVCKQKRGKPKNEVRK